MYKLLSIIYPSFIYTERFWKIVKRQYDTRKPYLCTSSILFRAYWDKDFSFITTLANEFLKETEYSEAFTSSNGDFLFCAEDYYLNVKVRTLFINWCIERYKK